MNKIHPTAVIGPNVELGDNVYIGPYCIIGFPAEHKGCWPNPGKVIIGDDCILTGLVTVDAGTESPTIIKSGVWMMKHSHVGHDAVIESGVTLSCGVKVGGHCWVQDGTNIGLNACIHQRVVIPKNCMIGMGAIITKKTVMEEGMKYAGNPAKQIGVNFKK